jgi:hypothetical protein
VLVLIGRQRLRLDQQRVVAGIGRHPFAAEAMAAA